MTDIRRFLAAHPDCILIDITGTQGSTPREAGTFMLASHTALWGTIGGGQFEFMAIANARDMLAGTGGMAEMDIPLGPDIGQCCGGRTQLRFRRVTKAVAEEIEARLTSEIECLPEVYLFGAGHVPRGRARL